MLPDKRETNMFYKLSDVLAYYQTYCLTGKHKYQSRLAHLRYFDVYALSEIKRVHIRQYALTRSESVKYATVNRELSFARAAINAVNRDYELTINNPFANIKFTEADFMPVYLSPDDVNKLLEAALVYDNQPLHDFIQLLVMTGCRPIELLTLTWDNVYLDKRQFIVRNHFSKSKRTMYKYLNDTALQVLTDMPRLGDYVFTNRRTGKPYESFGKSFARCKKRAGVNCRLYDLRHTYASWLVQGGVPIYTVKGLLGHRDIASTERYAHLDYSNYLNALSKIG